MPCSVSSSVSFSTCKHMPRNFLTSPKRRRRKRVRWSLSAVLIVQPPSSGAALPVGRLDDQLAKDLFSAALEDATLLGQISHLFASKTHGTILTAVVKCAPLNLDPNGNLERVGSSNN